MAHQPGQRNNPSGFVCTSSAVRAALCRRPHLQVTYEALLSFTRGRAPAVTCWPSRTALAERAGCSVRTLVYRLDALEATGLIRRERRWRNGQQIPTLYTIFQEPTVSAADVPPPTESECNRLQSQSATGCTVNQTQGNQTSASLRSAAAEPVVQEPLVIVPEPTPKPTVLARTWAMQWSDHRLALTGHRPTQPVPAVIKILAPFIEAGWSEVEIKRAMLGCGVTITRHHLEAALVGPLNGSRPPSKPSTTDQRIRENHERVAPAIARIKAGETLMDMMLATTCDPDAPRALPPPDLFRLPREDYHRA